MAGGVLGGNCDDKVSTGPAYRRQSISRAAPVYERDEGVAAHVVKALRRKPTRPKGLHTCGEILDPSCRAVCRATWACIATTHTARRRWAMLPDGSRHWPFSPIEARRFARCFHCRWEGR